MKQLIFLSIIILLYACSSSTSQKESKTSTESDTLSEDFEYGTVQNLVSTGANTFGCYYQMDEKHSEFVEQDEVKEWWNDKLNDIKDGIIPNEFLPNGGGGPNGAEWNTMCNLFLAATFNTSGKLTSTKYPVTIRINNRILNKSYINYHYYMKGIIVDFNIDLPKWELAFRSVDTSDYIPLYGKELMKQYEAGEPVFVAPPNTGKVLKVTVEIELENGEILSVVDYIHIAFGE